MDLWLSSLAAQVQLYLPRLISAIVLAIIAWVVAMIAKWVVDKALTAARVDQRYGKHVGTTPSGAPFSLTKTVSNTVFWLVILFFLPAILDALALPGLFAPVQTMVNRVFTFLPNLFAAAVIFLVGLFVARVVQRVVTGLLSAAGVDRFAERIGIAKALGNQTFSGLLGAIVFLLILIPVLISALDALGIAAITGPASTMLNSILTALPNIFAAFLMLAIAYIVGRVIAELVTDLLTAAGFNMLLERLGFSSMPAPSMASPGMAAPRPAAPGTSPAAQPPNMNAMLGNRTPAQIVGTVVLVAIMLFTAIEAMRLLGFMTLATMLAGVLTLMGMIALGLVIFGIGVYLSNLAYNAIRGTGSGQAELLAIAARIAILVLAGSMALRQMGLANEIVDLAFGLTLGAIAVAVALAFGLGGRETAARMLESWRAQMQPGMNSANRPAAPQGMRTNPAYGAYGGGGESDDK